MKAFRADPEIFRLKPQGGDRADLRIEGLTLRFGGVVAVHDVSLEVRTGEFFSVIGPNGAGKTSLLNCVTGYYRPQEGVISFNGKNVTRQPPHELVREGIGRTFQNIELFPGMSVLSNLLLARHIHYRYGFLSAAFFLPPARKEEVRHRRIVEEIIDFLEMQSIRHRLVGSLPYGLRKRVELGRALALEPKLLILDEPFAGMNLEEKEDMVRFLRELHEEWKRTIVLVEHDMSVVMSLSERIAVLNFGEKLAEGSPGEILDNPEVTRAYLGPSEEA